MHVLIAGWMAALAACDDRWPGAPSTRAPRPQPAVAPPLVAPPLVVPPVVIDDAVSPATTPAAPAPIVEATIAEVGDLRARLRAMQDGGVPQVRGALELFEEADAAAPAPRDAFDGGLLLCDVRVSPESDADDFKGPDLTLQVRAGSMRGNLRGAEDTWAWTMSMPISTLRDARAIWVRVVDRDTWSDEYVGSASSSLRTLPVRLRMTYARVSCAALPRARLTARIDRVAGVADRALAEVERARPDAEVAGFGYPFGGVFTATERLEQLAAWVRWEDPVLEHRAARLILWDETFHAEERAVVADLAARLPPPATSTPIDRATDARVVEILAGADLIRYRRAHPAADAALAGAFTVVRIERTTTAPPGAVPPVLHYEVVGLDARPHDATLAFATPTEWLLTLPHGAPRGPLLRITTRDSARVAWLRIE